MSNIKSGAFLPNSDNVSGSVGFQGATIPAGGIVDLSYMNPGSSILFADANNDPQLTTILGTGAILSPSGSSR